MIFYSWGGDIMTDAKRLANRRYSDKAYDRVAIRVYRGMRQVWHDAARARGLSLAGLIVLAVAEYVQCHPEDHPEDHLEDHPLQ